MRLIRLSLLLALAVPLCAQFGVNAQKLRGTALCSPLSPQGHNGYLLTWNDSASCWSATAPTGATLGANVFTGTQTMTGALNMQGTLNYGYSGGIYYGWAAYNAGNVAFGTNAYGYPLLIDGSAVLLNSASGGKVGIGTATPHSKLAVAGLSVYANNAAAITGGLSAGDFYRTGSDPDMVAVVH